MGDPSGALDATWGSTPPPGVTTPGWSARFTGYVVPAASGAYSFSVPGSGTTSLFVNNAPYSGPVTLSAGVATPIRLDYTAPSGTGASLALNWTPPGGATALIPGGNLDPGYGLATTHTDPDGKKTATQYAEAGVDPAEGLPTAQIVDPGGLGLTSTTTYEPSGTGFFRTLSSALPGGVTTTVSDAYYGATETDAATTCTSGGVVQGGLLRTETGAGASPVVHAFAYDAAGRVVASEVVGDAAWSCTSFDPRGRTASSSDAAGKTTTYDYSNPAVVKVTYSDSAGNVKTTSSQVDFDGRPVAYSDELANTSTQSYDQASRVVAH